MRKLLLTTAAVAAAIAWVFAAEPSFGTFTDGRDGQKYKTVVIGGKKWMTQNLNYETDSSWCYENKESNCRKYGRLYAWNAAKKACPIGWKLPDTTDWNRLEKTAGGDGAGKMLKSNGGWYKNGNGTDNYGFSALPGGLRYSDGNFICAISHGYWWTVTENGSNAYDRSIYSGDDMVDDEYNGKNYGFSVRCIADNP